MKQKFCLLILTVGLLLSLAACVVVPPSLPPAELSTIRIGTEPWIGYGPWWIAVEHDLFTKYGLAAELVSFTTDAELHAAMTKGEVQAANLGAYEAYQLFNQGMDIRIVLMEDVSYTADAIIAPDAIATIDALKGKRIAYEQGSVSEVLLHYALHQSSLSIDDIQPVLMPAADAGLALLAGHVDAAVTYEPYLSTTLAERDGFTTLYTAAEHPGLISDVLAVDASFLEQNPDTIRALLQIWDEAVAYYESNPASAQAIIAAAIGQEPGELQSAFDGIELFDLDDNRHLFSQQFYDVLLDGVQVAQTADLLDKAPDLDTLFVPDFLDESNWSKIGVLHPTSALLATAGQDMK